MGEQVTPNWNQPSHPDVQEVRFGNGDGFFTRSYSRVTLAPFALFARIDWPPATKAPEPSYATVQYSKNDHLNLNSDLLYINHSCAPSLIFDTSAFLIYAGPNGLKAGQELTFFYPSTEWNMAQGFQCTCEEKECQGFIKGAKHLKEEQVEGLWLNKHIRELLQEKKAGAQTKENHEAASKVATVAS